jgi:ferredoxin
MPKVTFVDEVVTVDAPAGRTIRQIACENGIPLERGFWTFTQALCRGTGLLGCCKVWVKPLAEGAVTEKGMLEKVKPGLKGTLRLACQARVRGDCEIRTKPGRPPVAQTTTWDPDPRPSRWKERLANAGKEKEEAADDDAKSASGG